MATETHTGRLDRSNAQFPPTEWSKVLALRERPDDPEILNRLWKAYGPAMYAFARQQGWNREDALDGVQSCLCNLSTRGDLLQVSPEKGRLRTFLMTALRNHLLKQRERERAQRRGGGRTFEPIDTETAERICVVDFSPDSDPERVSYRAWAAWLLERALRRLDAEPRGSRSQLVYETLRPSLAETQRQEYAGIGARLGMTANNVAVSVLRLRKRLRQYFREEIRHTIGSGEDAAAEERLLIEYLRQL